MVWRLQISLKQRMAVGGIFLLGGVFVRPHRDWNLLIADNSHTQEFVVPALLAWSYSFASRLPSNPWM